MSALTPTPLVRENSFDDIFSDFNIKVNIKVKPSLALNGCKFDPYVVDLTGPAENDLLSVVNNVLEKDHDSFFIDSSKTSLSSIESAFDWARDRKTVFITLQGDASGKSAPVFAAEVKKQIETLNCDFIDLLMVQADASTDFVALLKHVDEEKLNIKSFGLSNATQEQVKNLRSAGLPIHALFVTPDGNFPETVKEYTAQSITLFCPTPFGAQEGNVYPLLQNQTLAAIADSHQSNPESVLLSWFYILGVATLVPNTEQTFIANLSLSDEECLAIARQYK